MTHTENGEYSIVQGEAHSSSDNPIVRAVEIPAAAAVNQTHAVTSTGDVSFATVQCFLFVIVVWLE